MLLSLPDYLACEVWRPLRRTVLAAELGFSLLTISAAMRELHRAEVVERRGHGPLTEWRLALEYGWRGSARSYAAAVARRTAEREAAVARRPVLRMIAGDVAISSRRRA